MSIRPRDTSHADARADRDLPSAICIGYDKRSSILQAVPATDLPKLRYAVAIVAQICFVTGARSPLKPTTIDASTGRADIRPPRCRLVAAIVMPTRRTQHVCKELVRHAERVAKCGRSSTAAARRGPI